MPGADAPDVVRPVFLGADSVLCALGSGVGTCVDRMYAGETGLRMSREFGTVVGAIDPVELRAWDPSRQTRLEFLASRVAGECLDQARLPESARGDLLLLLMTTKGDVQALAQDPTPAPEAFLEHLARRIARNLHLVRQPVVISNACISGEIGLIYASRILRAGGARRILLLAIDELTHFVVEGFRAFHSLSAEGCRPYDAHRDGLSLGEAAAALLLTTDPSEARAPRVQVLGGAISNDANHISGPSRTGEGLALAIRKALAESDLTASAIELVNMHGTGTLYNDAMEAKALPLAGIPSRAVVNSLKGFLGHTLGAAGLLETLFTAESLRRGRNLPTHGLVDLGEEINASPQAIGRATRALKTSSGFGGCNSAVVLSMEPGDRLRSQPPVVGRVLETAHVHLPTVPPDQALDFLKAQFKALDGENLKFYRMDPLCRLGYVVAERLLRDSGLMHRYAPDQVAVLLFNRSSSLERDILHQSQLSSGEGASPATFVYTLPNVVAGEICIRHGIKGENCFFVGEAAREFSREMAGQTLAYGHAKAVIFGELDYLRGEYSADLRVLERT